MRISRNDINSLLPSRWSPAASYNAIPNDFLLFIYCEIPKEFLNIESRLTFAIAVVSELCDALAANTDHHRTDNPSGSRSFAHLAISRYDQLSGRRPMLKFRYYTRTEPDQWVDQWSAH